MRRGRANILVEGSAHEIRAGKGKEGRVEKDISLLIIPSTETLATYGATNLRCLIESINERWNNSIPVTKTRPQPDYSVGFRREVFTEDQLKRLEPFVGELTDTSFFKELTSNRLPKDCFVSQEQHHV
jgi:hypothetical protein